MTVTGSAPPTKPAQPGATVNTAVAPGPASAGPDVSPLRKPRRRQWWRDAETWWGYALIAPTGLGLAIFYLWPTVQTAYFSFTEWGPFGGNTWTGLDNYRHLVTDPEVWQALGNTVAFTGLGLLGIPISVVLAALLNRPGLRGVPIYRTLYFLPVVTMPVAVAMVWKWLYNGDYGLINYALSLVGVHGPHWVADPATAQYAIVIVGIWTSLGYNLVIFLAGMKAIPREYYEASALDGAGPVSQFFRVTVPLLSPSVFFVSIVSVIGSLQLFDLVFVISGGGVAARANPAFPRIETVVYLFYDKAFNTNDRGYAAAIAMGLLVLIVCLTAIQFRLQKRWVHYA